ncbi:MAG: hypothetical protein QOI96_83, partial [Verrucomicrobiota bacterium]
ITGDMFADYHSVGLLASEVAKNLRALAIKSFTELHVRWNRLWPPVGLNMSVWFDVAHDG